MLDPTIQRILQTGEIPADLAGKEALCDLLNAEERKINRARAILAANTEDGETDDNTSSQR